MGRDLPPPGVADPLDEWAGSGWERGDQSGLRAWPVWVRASATPRLSPPPPPAAPVGRGLLSRLPPPRRAPRDHRRPGSRVGRVTEPPADVRGRPRLRRLSGSYGARVSPPRQVANDHTNESPTTKEPGSTPPPTTRRPTKKNNIPPNQSPPGTAATDDGPRPEGHRLHALARVPSFPDPKESSGGISIGGPGLDPNSPQFQTAQTDCRSLTPGG